MNKTKAILNKLRKNLDMLEIRIEKNLSKMSPNQIRDMLASHIPERDEIWFSMCDDLGIKQT